ncbi:chromate transporter [Novosphingobium nitrogenifigens DSM 19370]|uniref:Chromate transporter n=2 Tax=Novosphingobium nitrogenifigens TaxID=378548 RepID=F1Z3T3_9SPHN|nr:chromate transporter [Novosphingobium nitrogenifigens DSM 19370]
MSFGGPVGQIALMHRELVEERGWIDEQQFLHALNFCHLLPGPEATQLSIWVGWKLHGVKGGVAAGLLFIIPGVLVILGFSIFYGIAAKLGWFMAAFAGIKAAVLALVVQAMLRVAGRALGTPFKKAVAVASFVALFLFDLPFPLVVLGAGALGALVEAKRPQWLRLPPMPEPDIASPRPWGASAKAVLIGGALWAAPIVLIRATLGPKHVLSELGSYFSQLAVVSFGGAYAVLASMAQQAVEHFGWLTAGEMADGLGLAETTPGPLIMVTQFVGYLAGSRAPAPFTPLVAGTLGALVTTWVTFAPCFLWIFTFAPWLERLEGARRLKGGLATLTAAIVGVIANLSLWFAIHVLFARNVDRSFGPVHLLTPVPQSLDWHAALLAALSAFLIFRLRWNVIGVLGLGAVVGVVLGAVG